MANHFVIADVFTDVAFGGNQLAVFPDATGISDRDMQAYAREINFSETTFVLPPRNSVNAFRIRIFTPRTELPFAGHPTVGTAAVLVHLGRVGGGRTNIVFEEGIGDVAITRWHERHQTRAARRIGVSIVATGRRFGRGSAVSPARRGGRNLACKRRPSDQLCAPW